MKRNPYAKYLGKEDILQTHVMRYISLKYPKALYTHVANEGKRTPFEQYKLKITPNANKSGLAIELKAGYNKPTENQKKWLKWLENANWVAVWHNNFDLCVETIDKYFNNEL